MKRTTKLCCFLLILTGVAILTAYHIRGICDVSTPKLSIAPACVAVGIIILFWIEKRKSKY